jgi:ketoreductase
MELSGAHAVVTGATEGIGRAIAFQLGNAGARVAICARTEPNVRATVQALRDARIDARWGCGATFPIHQSPAFAAFVVNEYGPPRVLVNNAGIGPFQGAR